MSKKSLPYGVGKKKNRIVALLAIRNDEQYLEKCLEHLYCQGIETCIIDNQSTDNSRILVEKFIGRGVFRIETQPYHGYFNLVEQLRIKEKLALEIDANWFIHHDADEIRQAPAPFSSLKEGIINADESGYNAINFDEFVFVPTSNSEINENSDYVAAMKYYYFFEPHPLRRINAWKKGKSLVDLISSGGHRVIFEGQKLFPTPFILKHYIGLSTNHLSAKYSERIYSELEIRDMGWHKSRSSWKHGEIVLPNVQSLKKISVPDATLDKSSPALAHMFKFNREHI